MNDAPALSRAAETDPASGNFRGILLIIGSMFCFTSNDTLIKLASEDLPTGQIIFLRGLLATVALFLLAWRRGALRLPRAAGRRPLFGRTAADALSTLLFLTALVNLSLATATAIMQSLPVVLTLASALFLGEVVRWRRWAAVAGGFTGVLMIVQPGGESFSMYSLVAVGGLLFVAARDLLTRYIPRSVPTLTVSVYGSFIVTLAGGALSVGEEWGAVSPRNWLVLAGAACFLIGGYIFIVEAMRTGELSVVAPFRYTIILFALFYSYVIWGEVPNGLALAGIVLVVASGLYVFHRESRLGRTPPPAGPGRPG